MKTYRNCLPQLSHSMFLTDGGLETTLIFHEELELPYFAAFDLLKDPSGLDILKKYYRRYADIAKKHGTGFILESATWRANPDWASKLGYSKKGLATMNQKAIQLLSEIRDEYENDNIPIVISGCLGPRGDGYNPADSMSTHEAEAYHHQQIEVFSQTTTDMITATTMTNVEEATGISQAAKSLEMPVVISFTVETDGNLPTGQPLKEAIIDIDSVTNQYPAYYMLNCAHPSHFRSTVTTDENWTQRIRGIRANASDKSHAELDEAPELDQGNPLEFGNMHSDLSRSLHNLNVFGGCCGTDHRHIENICHAVLNL